MTNEDTFDVPEINENSAVVDAIAANSPDEFVEVDSGALTDAAPQSLLESALSYVPLGFALVPCAPGQKRPLGAGWQKGPAADEAAIRAWFDRGRTPNIGLRLGEPSGGVIDIDCDDDELIPFLLKLAPPWLADCPSWTRDGRPHWIARCNPVPKPRPYKLGKKMLVELRADGQQTILPPSIHPSGAPYLWRNGPCPPPLVPGAEPTAWLEGTTVAFVLSKNWKEGSRNDLTLCAAGALARVGIPLERAKRIIKVAAEQAGDEEVDSRLRSVESSYARSAAGEATRGFAALKDLLDEDSAKLLTPILKAGGGPGGSLRGPAPIVPAEEERPHELYFARQGSVFMHSPQGPLALANFDARISAEEILDDGSGALQRAFIMRGSNAAGELLPETRVPAERFPSLDWIVGAYGAAAVIAAGGLKKDHLRAAIQTLSGSPPRQSIYTHTGWTEYQGNRVFLHAGGAIGVPGAVPNVLVRLPGRLSGYDLPAPPEGEDLARAVEASLAILDLAPDRFTIPNYGLLLRAALGDSDFGGHITGETGSGKSEFAALLQQHFGSTMNRLNLPGSWTSTANSLEWTAFSAKDVIFVVDDLVSHDQEKMFDRLFRSQGNQHGRDRMRADLSMSPDRYPRGVVLSTGEVAPRRASARARTLITELGSGAEEGLRWELLEGCQDDAASGLYAQAMSAFIGWLAPKMAELKAALPGRIAAARAAMAGGASHRRTPSNTASIAVAYDAFLEFALETGALDIDDADELRQRVTAALAASMADQASQALLENPPDRFLELVAAGIVSGAGHIASAKNKKPSADEGGPNWGWTAGGHDDVPIGRVRLGWIEGDDLFLLPDIAFAEASKLARQQGNELGIDKITLGKRLKERGLLISCDEKRQRTTVRRVLGGAQQTVWHVRPQIVLQCVEDLTWKPKDD